MRKILIFVAIAICWGVIWCSRADKAEGAIIQLIGFLVILRLVFLYLEVIRDEIIQALKKTSGPK